LAYKLYSRKSLINTQPLFYLKSDNPLHKYRRSIFINDLSFIKDVSVASRTIDVNFNLYTSVNYDVVHSIYLKLIKYLNGYINNQLYTYKETEELVADLELIIFSWD
jgi:hypothetical protein